MWITKKELNSLHTRISTLEEDIKYTNDDIRLTDELAQLTREDIDDLTNVISLMSDNLLHLSEKIFKKKIVKKKKK